MAVVKRENVRANNALHSFLVYDVYRILNMAHALTSQLEVL